MRCASRVPPGSSADADAWRFEVAIARVPRAKLERARPRHLGNARREAPFHALEGHGLGRIRPRASTTSRSMACAVRWRAGASCARASMPTSAARASIARATRSSSTTARPKSMRACLLIPQVGFLPPDDPRVRGTVAAIERDLLVDGLGDALSHAAHAREAAAGRRPLSRLLVLAGRCACALRPQRRRGEAVRAPAGAVQRRGTARRRIRSEGNGACWAIFRKRCRTWRSSTPRAICRGPAGPRSIAAADWKKRRAGADARTRADGTRDDG